MAVQKRRNWIWITLLVLVVAVPLLAIIIVPLSFIAGTEFSPDTFEHRQFVYMRVPGTQIVLSNRWLTDIPSFSQTLIDDQWVGENTSTETRWDLVMDNYTPRHSPDCDAQYLVQEIERRNDEYEFIWLQWTNKYPQRARVLWPIIADFARHAMYLYLSEIFEFCDQQDDLSDEQFSDQLQKLASKQCFHRAVAQAGTQPTIDQITAIQRSLGYYALPESLELLQAWGIDPSPITPSIPEPNSIIKSILPPGESTSAEAEDSGNKL